ncbi:MAG: hypothetical protein ACLRVE_07415 [Finegoldia magna]|uniref:hypothetical protein n=1 Tax=Finegoldia magna TaxID=1260 RepID=UPI0039A268AD
MRKVIYTTNSIENFNRQLRKAKKQNNISKRLRPKKSLYLAIVNASSKWTSRIRGWG